LVIYYGGNLDAPISNFLSNNSPNNYYGVWNHTTKDHGFRFFAHDSEHTLLDANVSRLGPYPAGSTQSKSNPQWIFQQLLYNPDFRILAADRIHKFLFNGGALTPASAIARFNKRRDEINRAIVGESARWGDAKTGGAPYTYQTWQTAINTVLNSFFPSRTANLLNQFKATAMGDGTVPFTLYPSLAAPEFVGAFGGTFSPASPIQITNPNGAAVGAVYYTLDGSDPRLPGGALNPAAIAYAAPGITLSASTRIRARVLNGTAWSAILDAAFTTATPPPLRVSEIMYHPADPAAGSAYTASDFEYVELTNISNAPLNLNKFSFSNGITFTFPSMTLPAGGKTLVVSNLAAFQSRYGTAIPVAGVYDGNLDNDGEKLTLLGALGETVQSFSYNDSWQPQTDGEGFSLEARNLNQTLALYDDKLGWRASNLTGGDPGTDSTPPVNADAVVINEISAKTAAPNTSWVELRNLTNASVDLSNWFLSNDPTAPKKYQLPAGTVIAANGYLLFNEQSSFGQAAGSPGVLTSFSFDGDGNNTIVLSQADAAGNLMGYRQFQDYGATDVGQSVGRYVKSTGDTDFTIQKSATPGADNAGPLVGPGLINEVMYGPIVNFGGTNFPNPNMEFVELRNATGQILPLYDVANPANTWRVTGGVNYQFPQSISIPASGYLVLTNLDPAAFRTLYPSTPAAVTVLGPVSGFLNNAGEKITLQRPGVPETTPTGTVVPYITVDKLNYDSKAPWPTTPNELGKSLIRIDPTRFGNDVNDWQASLANGGTPGVTNLPSLPPVVDAGPDSTGTPEGATWSQQVSFTDPDLGQSYQAVVSWGDTTSSTFALGTIFAGVPFTIGHAFKDNGAYSVKVTVFDTGGASAFDTALVSIVNAPPTATFALIGSSTVPEGSSRNVTFTNPSDPSITDTNAGFKYSYDWDNDGVYDLVDSGSSTVAIPPAILADGPATKIIKAKIADKDGGFTEYTVSVNVTNVAPAIDAIDEQDFPTGAPATLDYPGGAVSDASAADLAAGFVGAVDWDYHPNDADAVPLTINAADGTFALNHTYAQNGTYVVRVTATDKDGGTGVRNFVVHVGADAVPPALTDAQFLFNSGTKRLTFSFSEDVSASLAVTDLTVHNLSTNADVPVTLGAYNASSNTQTFSFTGNPPDGYYRATLAGTGVDDGAGHTLNGGDGVFDFWFLAADANRDKAVNFADLVLVAQNYNLAAGGAWARGDFNGDAKVDFADLVIIAQNYNQALPPNPPGPSSPVAASGVTAPVLVSTGSGQMPALSSVPASVKSTPTSTVAAAAPPKPPAVHKPVKPVVVKKPRTAGGSSLVTNPVFSTSKIVSAKKRSDLLD
jgi:hypothetical protein